MFVFGEFEKIETIGDLKAVFTQAKKVSLELSEVPIDDIINDLDSIGKAWQPAGKWYQKALALLPEELSFDPEMIRYTLDLIPNLLSKQTLYQRLNAELEDARLLDQLGVRHNFNGKVRYFPRGTLLHVSAGNNFLGCIDSLLMGLLTKNINVLKLSSKNQIFPRLFAESILEISSDLAKKFAIVYWKGGDEAYENIAKKNANAIIAWGGEEMLTSYKKNLPIDVKLIDYGPKISIQVLTNEYLSQHTLENTAKKIVNDISLWDQSACASSQNLYVEKGIDVKALMSALDEVFQAYEIERGELSPDEQVDILKEKFRAEYSFIETQIDYIDGKDYFIHFDPNKILRPSPLNRTLIIKPFEDPSELAHNLKNFSFYLQTCGIGVTPAERESWIQILAMAGVKRFTDLGKMLTGMTGAPHDGRYGLLELVHTIAYEHEDDLDDFLISVCEDSPFYKQYYGKSLQDFPLMDGKTLSHHLPVALPMSRDHKEGLVFASGGTTGVPKYSLYSSKEFEQTAKLLGKSYMLAGLSSGDVVANLFVAGNMWSSFSAVQLALQACPVLQLPIGGNVNIYDLKKFLLTFKVNVVFGLPGMLLDLAHKLAEIDADISIEKVFYAGESCKDSTKKSLEKLWGVQKFISAGYASVDVGPIGYQVPNGAPGEHYLFEHIHPEIINEELVVTSTLRTAMPIIRYKTGDRVKLLEKDHIGQKFQLLGRADSIIQLWGCRFSINDIAASLTSQIDFQLVLEHQKSRGDILKILIAAPLAIIDQQFFCQQFYQNCMDVQRTVSLEFLLKHVDILVSSFEQNKRTGKIPKVIDLR